MQLELSLHGHSTSGGPGGCQHYSEVFFVVVLCDEVLGHLSVQNLGKLPTSPYMHSEIIYSQLKKLITSEVQEGGGFRTLA